MKKKGFPRGRVWDCLLALAVCGGFVLLSEQLIPFRFSINDDLAMISVLNGSFTGTPDGHAVFISYPLGCFISLLYATGIQICWYKWVLLASSALGLACVLYRLLRRFPGHRLLASGAVLALFSLLWLPQLMRATFTTCSGLMMVCTILVYAFTPAEEEARPGALGSLLLLLALTYQWRDYFGYIVLPFLAVLWLGKHWGSLRKNRACWLVPLAGLVCFALMLGVERMAYSGDWAAYQDYNDARSSLQDFKLFPKYDDHRVFLEGELGLTKEEYYTVSHYDYDLLDDFGPETVQAIYDYVKSTRTSPPLTRQIRTALSDTVSIYGVKGSMTPIKLASLLAPVALLAALIYGAGIRQKMRLLSALFLLLGSWGCWVLVAYNGRTPDRVVFSLRLLTVAACLAGLSLILTEKPLSLPDEKKSILAMVLALVLAAGCVFGVRRTISSLGSYHAPRQSYLTYAKEHPEQILIRDTYSTMMGSHANLREFPRVPVNVLSSGGWLTYSPLYWDKLEALGISEVNRSLLVQDNVFLLVDLNEHNLNRVLGVSKSASVDYDVVQVFDGYLSMVDIHSIGP